MKQLFVLASFIVSASAYADDWRKYVPEGWVAITVADITKPVHDVPRSDPGSVINVLEMRKAKKSERQCNKKTEQGNYVPVHCGSAS